MSKTNTRAAISRSHKNDSANLVVSLILCGIVGIIAVFFCLLGFSWLFIKTNLPFWSAVPLATVSLCVGCLICGFLTSRKVEKNGLFCGLCSGVVFFLVGLFAALLNGQFVFTAVGSIKLVSCILSGCLGGFLGILSIERHAHAVRKPLS